MEIIQSYWSKPHIENSIDRGLNGGWPNELINHLSMALSLHYLLKSHKEVNLFTDRFGYDLLINRLQLPYTNVSQCLDDLSHFDASLWSLGKVYSYSIQNKPFLHVDLDVFVWDGILNEFNSSEIVAQSELCFDNEMVFDETYNYLISNLDNCPAYVQEYWKKYKSFKTCNAGIMGGNDIYFFNSLFSEVEKYVKNVPLKSINSQWLNMLFEEHFIYCKAMQFGSEISYLCKDISLDFREVNQIHLAPMFYKYIHLAGNAKRSKLAINQIIRRARLEIPSLFSNCCSLYPDLSRELNRFEIGVPNLQYEKDLYNCFDNILFSDFIKKKIKFLRNIKITEISNIDNDIVYLIYDQHKNTEICAVKNLESFIVEFSNERSIFEIVEEHILKLDNIGKNYFKKLLNFYTQVTIKYFLVYKILYFE